jgi:hypothetical protein
MTNFKPTLLIACGALAREVIHLIESNNWHAFVLECLPADLHNKPKLIPNLMREKIKAAKKSKKYDYILALYGDCGTGGLLDAVLEAEQVERIPGAHCYEFFSTSTKFDDLTKQEIGSFYLTDYLTRFFDRLIIKGLGIDRFPELKDIYFANYKRIVYLAQTDDPELDRMAKNAAAQLGLEYVHQKTSYGGLELFMSSHAGKGDVWQNR